MNVLWISSTDEVFNESQWTAAGQPIHLHKAAGSREAIALMTSESYDAVVINTPLEDCAAAELIEEFNSMQPHTPILIRNEQADMAEAVRLTKVGAFHFLDRSTPVEDLGALLATACECARSSRSRSSQPLPGEERWRELLIGDSDAVQRLVENIRLLGPRRCTVLITGETGTGKELVARALHLAGKRSQQPMVALNCSALPENLLEAELFGHVRGAFTGAVAHRTGRFEQANRGTLFLDEIADMPLEVQTKLLRVLQEREFQRLGSSETVRVDVRVIAACNVDLGARAANGRFREDLYYRLNVVPIEIPPLRDRLEDVPMLVRHFVRKVAAHEGLPVKQAARETLERLMRYHWPGNVRQLENTVEMAMILSGDRNVLYPADFRLQAEAAPRGGNLKVMPPISVPDHGLDFERTVGRIERDILEQALQKTRGNKKQAAEMLGLKRTTLSAKLKSLEALVG